jgi:pilus assembly protein Flp/PilA
MLKWVCKLKGDQDGATAVEYGLILALVVLATMGAIVGLAGTTIEMWGDVANKVDKT